MGVTGAGGAASVAALAGRSIRALVLMRLGESALRVTPPTPTATASTVASFATVPEREVLRQRAPLALVLPAMRRR